MISAKTGNEVSSKLRRSFSAPFATLLEPISQSPKARLMLPRSFSASVTPR